MGSIFSFLRFDYGYGSSIPISDFNPHSEKNKNKKSKLLSPKDDILTESSSNKEDTESEEDSPMSAEKYQLQSYKKKEEEVPVISAEDYQLQTFKQKAEEGLPKDVTQTCATVTCEGQVGPATGSATGTVCWPTAPGWAGTTITLNGGGGVLF